MTLVIPDTHRVVLLPATTITADGTTAGSAHLGLDKYNKALILLTISAKTMDASTTLDIYVQYSPDFGTTYDDIAHFAQVTNAAIGNGTYIMVLNSGTAGIADRATDDAATLAANNVRNQPWGDRMRIKYTSANFAGTDTITVTASAWFYP
jgi:hypothetical protein